MYETEFCKVEYLGARNAVLCRWKKRCSAEDYRSPLEFGLNLIREHQASLWITDTTHGFESAAEDTQWLLETFIPDAVGTSCDAVAFIIAEGSPLQEEIAQQSAALSHHFRVQTVRRLDEVR